MFISIMFKSAFEPPPFLTTSEADFTLFSEAYDAAYPLLKKDNVIVLRAHKDERRDDTYILDSAEALTKGE